MPCDLCDPKNRRARRRLLHSERPIARDDDGGTHMCDKHWMMYVEEETQKLAKTHGWWRPRTKPAAWMKRARRD